jgi:phosphoribosylformylglycinamidine synthase
MVSESQERMTFSVPPQKVQRFINLLKSRGVEATVIGEFTSSGRAVVRYHGGAVLDLDMDFLHDGLPQKCFVTEYRRGGEALPVREVPGDFSADVLAMLGRLNLCSYEWISMQYDHEVQGNSVLKPLQGPGRVQASATVIRPLLQSKRGVVLSQGLYPT